MKKVFRLLVFSFLVSLVFSACKSKEEKVIGQLDNLAEQVEKKSENWDSEQWKKAFKEAEKIHSDMSECDFTDAQLQKLGEVKGRLTAVMIKNGVPAVGKGIGSFIEGAASFLDGFQDGVQNGAEESLEEIGNYVNGALDILKEQESDD